jgi:hypothetical protein
MTWHAIAPAMLWGLLGVAIPVVIHLLNRRRVTTVDWGAMQFLELGRRARRRFELTELMLMAARMLLLALVALAVARPFWQPRAAQADAVGRGGGGGGERRDVVLILDGSESMDRKAGGTTPRALALPWARRFVAALAPGDTVAVLVAKDRVRPLVEPPSADRAKVEAALKDAPASRGSSDLPTALAEAFRILEKTRNPGRDVVILTDGQRLPWRPGEPARWALLRDLQKRMPVPPRIWAITFHAGARAEGADGSVGPLEVSRPLASPNMPVAVRTTVANAGPGPLTRTAELLVDGLPVPGSAQVVGPVPAGGKVPLSLRATIAAPGSHLLAVRLAPGDDPLPGNDEAERPIEVAAALPVLLVDGEPGLEPLSNETDFLRAALAPGGDDTPQVRTIVVKAADFRPESLDGQRVVVLANVERLGPSQASAVAEFLGAGGGVLVAPGDRCDAEFYNDVLFQGGAGWLPAALGEWKGEPGRRQAVAHPSPRSFVGPALAPFGQGEAPPLAEADLFAYRVLRPATRAPGAAVTARLDTGDPWVVERPARKGRVAVLAGPVDAEGGTLPVNPDFVPWAHELVFHLAAASGTPTARPGEPIVLDLDPAPPEGVTTLPVRRPDGSKGRAEVVRSGGKARMRIDDTGEPGIYRVALPDPPGGSAYAAVAGDGRESDPEPLAPAEAAKLAEGWPLSIESDPDRLTGRLLASGRGDRHPIWRGLVFAALAGLCLEVWMTRRLVRSRGIADPGGPDS